MKTIYRLNTVMFIFSWEREMHNASYQRLATSHQFDPQVFHILEQIFPFTSISLATKYQDKAQATDMMIGDAACAVRLRNVSYLEYNDLALRYRDHRGDTSEYHKILSGFGRFYFYGYDDGKTIKSWRLIDLNKFREAHPTGRIINCKDDGLTQMITFKNDPRWILKEQITKPPAIDLYAKLRAFDNQRIAI